MNDLKLITYEVKKTKVKPLSSATPEEMQEAFLMGGLWISGELEGHTESGAFSEQNQGIPAVEYFPMKAYDTLSKPDCKWKWKEGADRQRHNTLR